MNALNTDYMSYNQLNRELNKLKLDKIEGDKWICR